MDDNVEKLVNALVKKSGLKEKDIIKERSEAVPPKNPYKIKSKVDEGTGQSESNSRWQKMQTEFLCNQRHLKVYISDICKDDLEIKHDVYGKRQTAKMKLLSSAFSSRYCRIKIFVFAVNSKRHFSIFA